MIPFQIGRINVVTYAKMLHGVNLCFGSLYCLRVGIGKLVAFEKSELISTNGIL